MLIKIKFIKKNLQAFLCVYALFVFIPSGLKALNLMDDDALDYFINEEIEREEIDDFERAIDIDNLEFDRELFDRIRREKDEDIYVSPEIDDVFDLIEADPDDPPLLEYPPVMPDLPYEARLQITGRKSIALKTGHSFWLGDEEERTLTGNPPGLLRGFEMDQELRVRIQGQVGDKITVDVDYDDTKPAYDESARRISVVYKGDPDEIIQEAAFGDITLTLPRKHFIGYSRSVFGARVKGRYRNLDFMAIASQTKGRTEVKEFTGDTTFTRRDIRDIDYIRRRHYSIDVDTSVNHLPIEPGSVEVFLRDGVSETGVKMDVKYVSGDTHNDYFERLVPGRDFTVDHQTGILTFSSSLSRHYIAAVRFTGSQGTVGETDPVIFADEQREGGKTVTEYERKNFYSLGASRISRDDFVLRFLDTNRKPDTPPKPAYTVDYDRGILEFDHKMPFDPEDKKGIYDTHNPQHNYIIYVEFKSRIRQYFLRPNIVRGSERIVKDGRVLSRNTDYLIDYPSGFITFLRPEEIDETTTIRATYEYMPFGIAQQETLVGLRADYRFSRNLSMGGTLLYNFAASEREIPRVGQTPQSALVLGSNIDLTIPTGRYNPFPTRISAEVARSEMNPNTIGKAMIDDMDGIRITRSVSLRKDQWQIAATPSERVASPSWIDLDEDDDKYLSDINPNVSRDEDEKVWILEVDYDIPATDKGWGSDLEVSIVNPISRTGIDIGDMDKIQLWFKGDLTDAELDIDFGVISEDADRTGVIKPHPDKIEDSRIEGWQYVYPGTAPIRRNKGWNYDYVGGGVFTIGADNGRIDTNDLDRDGILDRVENVATFEQGPLSSDKWRRLEFDIGELGEGERANLRFVKHVRITVRNKSGARNRGKFYIAKLEAIGNHWEASDVHTDDSFRVLDVNTFDNPDYRRNSPEDEDIYKDIYSKVGGRDDIREGALELNYELEKTTSVYAYMEFPAALDFSRHKKLEFLLYGKDAGQDAVFFIEFGAGDNFYRKEYKISDYDFDSSGWEKFTISLSEKNLAELEKTGTPSISNVREIRVGIRNDSAGKLEGKVWVNVIHLSDSIKQVGTAERFDFSSTIPGILEYGGTYEHVTEDFQTITEPPRNQEITAYSANARLTLLDFLPVRGRYSQRETVTPADRIRDEDRNPYIRARDEGKVVRKDGSLDADLRIRRLPDIGGHYSRSIERSDFSGRIEELETIRGNLSYSPPLDVFIVPRSLRGNVRRTIRDTAWDDRIIDETRDSKSDGGKEDWSEVTYDFGGSSTFDMFGFLDFRPAYSKNVKDRTWDFYAGDYEGKEKTWPWSRRQKIDMNSTLTLARWFRPSFSYGIDTNEDYNFDTVNGSPVFIERKDVDRNFDIDSRVRFGVKHVIPGFDPVETLELDLNYRYEKGESYKNLPSTRSVFDKLDWRKEIDSDKVDSATKRDTRRYGTDWRPFDFMNLSGDWLKAVGDMRLRTNYRKINSFRLSQNTIYEKDSLTWPDLTADFGRLPRLPYAGRTITEIDLRGTYTLATDLEYSYSDGIDRDDDIHGISEEWRRRYGVNSRFKIRGRYDSLLDYTSESAEKIDLRDLNPWDWRDERRTYSGQIKVELRRYWDVIARFSHSRHERVSYPDILRTDSRSYSPSLSFRAVIDLPDIVNVPLFGDVAAGNRLRLDADLKADFARSELDIYRTNTNSYTFNCTGQLDVAANMRGSFGFGAQYVHNIERYANSYAGINLRAEVVITF